MSSRGISMLSRPQPNIFSWELEIMLKESRKMTQATGNREEMNQRSHHYNGNVVSIQLVKLACPNILCRIELVSIQVSMK